MDISESEKFKEAYTQYQLGDYKMAQSIIFNIYKTTKSDLTKLQCIMGLVAPNNHENPDETINYCSEGISLAGSLNRKEEVAYLKACKGNMLSIKAMPKYHRLGELTLPPGWFEFSLEAEKEEYNHLKTEADSLLKGMSRLISQAEQSAENLNNKSILAHVLMYKGQALSEKYSILLLQSVRGFRFKKLSKWLRFNLFLLEDKKVKFQLETTRRELKQAYLKSYDVFRMEGDLSNAGHALYNLANSLRNFSSVRFLRRAEKLAVKSKSILLLKMIKVFGKKIFGYSIFKYLY